MTDHHDAGLEADLAVSLTEMRKTAGLTQDFVAQRIGTTDACVSQWELGTNFPKSMRQWQGWARAVGADLLIRLEA
jgi:DNA-binding transcriptional regulator YiaG